MQPAPKAGPRPQPSTGGARPTEARPHGETQTVLEVKKRTGLSQVLLQQVHQSLMRPQRQVTSRFRQIAHLEQRKARMAHLEERKKSLKAQIQRQSHAFDRQKEQLEQMQEQDVKYTC